MCEWWRALKKGVLPFLGVGAHWQTLRRERVRVTSCGFTPSPSPRPYQAPDLPAKVASTALKGSSELRFVEATQWRIVPAGLPSSVSGAEGSSPIPGEAQGLCSVS